jgi:hypothetical protein
MVVALVFNAAVRANNTAREMLSGPLAAAAALPRFIVAAPLMGPADGHPCRSRSLVRRDRQMTVNRLFVAYPPPPRSLDVSLDGRVANPV